MRNANTASRGLSQSVRECIVIRIRYHREAVISTIRLRLRQGSA